MSIKICLNGISKIYSKPISLIKVIEDIQPSLLKVCVAGIINKKIVSIYSIIENSSNIMIITSKDNLSLDIIRSSCAHLLGYTIKKLWPNSYRSNIYINNSGFYYDFEISRNINKQDLYLIESEMKSLVALNYAIKFNNKTLVEAKKLFLENNEKYKVILLDRYSKKKKKFIKIFSHQKNIDIFTGIQVPFIGLCSNFKIQKVSSVYWDNNRKNTSLNRIYVICWANKVQLDQHVHKLQELNKRDHRKISKKLDLYHVQDDAPGMIFWHSNGWVIFKELENFIRSELKKYNYQEVKTPLIIDKKIWEKSGHWENYKKFIFTTSSENRNYCIKPMNCPAHIQIFNQKLRSYRDLPIRISEFGICHRKESSGSLHGLMRARSFTQDDGHIFCTKNQIRNEINSCLNMILNVYNIFHFKKIKINLSTRPENRIGDENTWNQAENDLISSLNEKKLDFNYQKGEGAFYGPKIELLLEDSLDRTWQCGTIQLDFYLSSLLNAKYVNKNNEKKNSVIIHRAILGSVERFIGMITEEYIGSFPTWLSPIQVLVVNITDNQISYVNNLKINLFNNDIRANIDIRNVSIGLKIREFMMLRIPYMLICGDKEINTNTVSVRTRSGKNFNNIDFNFFVKKIKQEIYKKSYNSWEE